MTQEPKRYDKNERQIFDALKESLMNKIAAEITLSSNSGVTMKKWRVLFELKQSDVARKMSISPSVLSDYEKGKRRSPGIGFIRRFIKSIIELDEERGGHNIYKFSGHASTIHKAIIDISEYRVPRRLGDLLSAIEGTFLWGNIKSDAEVYGYTVIDSLAAIRYMESHEFIYIFGANSMRLLVFTGVSTGRSPMIAAKVFPIKPTAIALHGPKDEKEVDLLAIELAESIGVPLILSKCPEIDKIVSNLRRAGE
ncbi:MAG: helix-turn-helix domain-containing protein [Nitrososphaerota archaeon]